VKYAPSVAKHQWTVRSWNVVDGGTSFQGERLQLAAAIEVDLTRDEARDCSLCVCNTGLIYGINCG